MRTGADGGPAGSPVAVPEKPDVQPPSCSARTLYQYGVPLATLPSS